MNAKKYDVAVVKFMTLFQELRQMIDDDPARLEEFAIGDGHLKRLCVDLHSAASFLSMNERRRIQIFAAPVDPKFIAAWRDFEGRYASPLAGIDLDLPGLALEGSASERQPRHEVLWDFADDEAQQQVEAIESALDFAEDQATDEGRHFPAGFPESIEEGTSAWKRLAEVTTFDLRGIFRRRELVPFVLIPRHVSQSHGDAEKLSLLTHLQQAHDAFIFGVPFAALALMRSILEIALKQHYRADGRNLAERIDNCQKLPQRVPKPALHRLRRLSNDILHFNSAEARLPKNMEKELLSLLYLLCALIEGAPNEA